MPIGFSRNVSNVDVLEAKFKIYEDLSKEMLDKLERAVDKISESNQNVALILERHENRLEQSDKADAAIIELIKGINIKLDKLEKRIDELSKFRWMTVGIATAATVVIGSATFFGNILTAGNNGATVGGSQAVPTR